MQAKKFQVFSFFKFKKKIEKNQIYLGFEGLVSIYTKNHWTLPSSALSVLVNIKMRQFSTSAMSEGT